MVGDRELKIYYEGNSLKYAREVTTVFRTARSLGVSAFVPRRRHVIQDDHLPLNEIARIPTTDLIDFDYPRPDGAAIVGIQSKMYPRIAAVSRSLPWFGLSTSGC